MAYTASEAERAARRLDTATLKSRHKRSTINPTTNRESHAQRAARQLDRRLGIAPQKKTRASRLLARERRKAMRQAF